MRAGELSESGDPRPWRDGENTPVQRLAQTFATEPANGVEWYFPRRLTIDVNGADQMKRNKVADFLGLRLWHTKQIDVPLMALQTDLTVFPAGFFTPKTCSVPDGTPSVASGRPVAASHTNTPGVYPPATMSFPSGLHATA